MPRVAHTDPPRRINVTLPESLVAELELRFYNPMTGGVQYGARSALIASLIRAWLDQTKEKHQDERDTDDDAELRSGGGGGTSPARETLSGGEDGPRPEISVPDPRGPEIDPGGVKLRDLASPDRTHSRSDQFEFEEEDEG